MGGIVAGGIPGEGDGGQVGAGAGGGGCVGVAAARDGDLDRLVRAAVVVVAAGGRGLGHRLGAAFPDAGPVQDRLDRDHGCGLPAGVTGLAAVEDGGNGVGVVTDLVGAAGVGVAVEGVKFAA